MVHRAGHVPMGTVVLGLSSKLAFFTDSGPALSPNVGFFLLLEKSVFSLTIFGRFVIGQGDKFNLYSKVS